MHDGVVIIGQAAGVHKFSAPAVGVVGAGGLAIARADLQVANILHPPGIFIKLERSATILGDHFLTFKVPK